MRHCSQIDLTHGISGYETNRGTRQTCDGRRQDQTTRPKNYKQVPLINSILQQPRGSTRWRHYSARALFPRATRDVCALMSSVLTLLSFVAYFLSDILLPQRDRDIRSTYST